MDNYSRSSQESKESAPGADPYLVAAVEQSRKESLRDVSESTAIVMDELGDTAGRRRVTLLRKHKDQ